MLRGGTGRLRWHAQERLDQLFEARVDALAVQGRDAKPAADGGQERVSFRELDQRANRLARWLRRFDLGSGDRIGLLIDQPNDSYVALLAILKINAAFVPLDVSFPADRIGFIAKDAELKAIVTLGHLSELLAGIGIPTLALDENAAAIAALSGERLGENEKPPAADELAYVIYTSGTTGKPKGVAVDHASIVNFVQVAAETYGYAESDRVYQGMTIAFDFSVEELWVPLLVGATLVPPPPGGSLVGDDLAAFLDERRVTALACVPTLLASMTADVPELRLLLLSGESCPGDLVERWRRPGRRILNAYGPTEATVTCTVADLLADRPVTIGAPLPTYTIVILDTERDEEIEDGQVGEIGVAGIGLARGYLNRPELTALKFIPDFLNLPDNPSGRIYRTGDLGRITSDGEVEFLGRIDTQIKLRGYRIELSEIESALLRVPEIAAAVVDVCELVPGEKELAAYFTLKQGAADPPRTRLAEALRASLPRYMIPAYLERLDEIPTLPSGKADRKQLPLPAAPRLVTSRSAFVAPSDATEAGIAAELAALLGVEQISMHDHFFEDLGANSLLMARFCASLRKEGRCDLSMRDVYRLPTIAQVAEHVRNASPSCRPVQRDDRVHIASDLAYYGCGTLQLLALFGMAWFAVFLLVEGVGWIAQAPTSVDAYGRAAAYSVLLFALGVFVPIAVKWLVIGRWRQEEFPIWSWQYFRFWLVGRVIGASPLAAFLGTPIYTAYLRLLGARVDWNAAIYSPLPVCTDLIEVGDGAIVRKKATMLGFRAQDGRIRIGGVSLGRNTFVGESSTLEPGTVIEDGAELGPSSSTHEGQRLHAGQLYHGSPAEETATSYNRIERGRLSWRRKLTLPMLSLFAGIFALAPAILLLISFAFNWFVSSGLHRPSHDWWADIAVVGGVAAALLLIRLALETMLAFVLPRLAYLFLEPGRNYKLYGLQYLMARLIQFSGNSAYLNRLFGDSSYVTGYLAKLGYRFKGGIKQTGSNFGNAQHHDIPFLCEIGRGTMVSDELTIVNEQQSNAYFRLSKAAIGANSFMGNVITYPASAATGDNCLYAIKVLVPVDGPIRENVGLLGSPSFEIPRASKVDDRFQIYDDDAVVADCLLDKNRTNLHTIGLFLLNHWAMISIGLLFAHALFVHAGLTGPFWFTAGIALIYAAVLGWEILAERAVMGFKPMTPRTCSIYEPYFWQHERYWKISVDDLIKPFDGTPVKAVLWRLLGVCVGKKVYDGGCGIAERTLTQIGDYCTLNPNSYLQGHSLEDAIFKSGPITIGDRCTIGTSAFVHYDVELGSNVAISADAFVMKGERPANDSLWRGNPAKAEQVDAGTEIPIEDEIERIETAA